MRLFTAILSTILPLGSSAVQAPEDADDAGSFRKALLAAVQRVRSVHCTYQFYYDIDENITPGGRFVRIEVALGGSSAYYMDFSHGSSEDDWRSDPLRTRTFVIAEKFIAEWPTSRYYEVKAQGRGMPLPDSFAHNAFYVSTGWWPPDSPWPAPILRASSPHSLAEVAISGDYRVLANEESLGIYPCRIMEAAGLDRLWIDERNGYLLRKRELREPRTGSVSNVFELDDYRECAPGVQLPGRLKAERHQMRVGSTSEQASVHRSLGVAIELHANESFSRVANFEPAPGALELDRLKLKCEQVKPGGLDYLESLASQVRASSVAGGSAPATEAIRVPGWLVASAAGIGVLPLASIVLRRLR